MANTFELISAVTVGSGGATDITFSSIPATYTDLAIQLSWRSDGSVNNGSDAKMDFNGSTANFTRRSIYSNGASASSSNSADDYSLLINPANATASTFASSYIYIPNYAGSAYKSFSADTVTENNGTTALMFMTAGLWSNTAAINSIKVFDYYGNKVAQYSTAYLYGVKNA